MGDFYFDLFVILQNTLPHMQIVFILLAFIIGFLLAAVILSGRFSTGKKEAETKFIEADRNNGILTDRLEQNTQLIKSIEDTLSKERKSNLELNSSLAEQRTMADNLRDKLEVQKKDVDEIQKRFIAEFENLSSKILDEKSKKFTEQNKTNLDVILNPLKEKIKEFEQKVEQTYKVESAERNSLKGEIKSLIELNKRISEEANNLAKALKGDTKKQGNWGEVILERILERSGLTKGSEYEMQWSTTNEEGRRIQPDVVIFLPDEKHIIIDAKVSLIAYEAMVNAVTDEDRERYLKEHLISVRSHIKNLSEKSYFSSPDISSPDFVLIFMPIEPSFGIAVQADAELFNYAWDKKIVLVSPSTLLATLKTVSAIWKHEKQTRNAIEIARVGGALYDKFYNFVKDLKNIGEKINAAQQSHQDAMNKLSDGSGNIIRKVEELKRLGAKSTKDIPADLLEKAEENDASQNQ
jgi:DNA recombination protein RmuC